MELNDAINFLGPAVSSSEQPARWCDLGCGEGLFTQALANLLPAGSSIEAVDKQDHFNRQPQRLNIKVGFTRADFVFDSLPLAALDGMLMANALHYVKDKPAFIGKARHWLRPQGQWVIIEYETTRANPWVPYPLNFESFTTLFRNAGYQVISKTAERRSLYNSGKMYCATVK